MAIATGMLVLDIPRYAVTNFFMVLWDVVVTPFRQKAVSNVAYYPTVCAIVAGYNEEEVLGKTLSSIYGTYPFLEIVVVDDGSTDRSFEIATEFARKHSGVKVVRRPVRGGKGSAVNYGIHYTNAEVLVILDADSEFGPNAIFNIVQPLRDPKVGAVSGAVHIRNTEKGLCTWLQGLEYLSTIQVGRIFSSKIGTLSIASGAFAAFRHKAVKRGFGWDASVGEDLDTTIRIRKAGWKTVFTPLAECFTNGPESFKALFRQRVRWDRSYVRYEVRKHNGIANLFWNNFRLSSFVYWYEQFFFNVVLTSIFWVTMIAFFVMTEPQIALNIYAVVFFFYILFSGFQVLIILFYSNNLKRDIPICLVFPLYIFYSAFLRIARLWALIDEFVYKSSYRDNYVPAYVQKCIQKSFRKF